ncbi:MAG: hypothetical protein EBV69_04950, partial [Oxalobacteraceae bacterium]|nr:hypothetical protein [Oxalobacteraceae bacterium]
PLRCVMPRDAGFKPETVLTPELEDADAGLAPELDVAEALSASDLVAMTILSTLTVYWLAAC